ncbi:RHS repeat domain-containing protein [Pseudomonas sp. NPDC098740]|uniref:RHS repeat domain-containing protein n=1 Tax=Pseudomonas sp. NPDC098740 TaxID=3364486 RepID=UPI00383A5B1B
MAEAPLPANQHTIHRLDGMALKITSVDAGWRLSLPGLAGEELQLWDPRGSHWRTTYDLLLRPLAIEESGEPNVETFTYADSSADPAFNRRGQLTAQVDRSGTLSLDSYSLLGQPLRETRTLAESKPYRSSRSYGPLGTLLSQTDAGDHQQQLCYDVAGQLQQVQLRIKDGLSWESVLKDAQYNAAGQIIEQCAGNDVLSTWTYDPVDGRLSTQRAQKNAEPALQNLEYFYDRVGNITRIEDHAFKPTYFANQLIDGHREFTYDSLYRLISATGYDDAPPSDIPGRPSPGDPNNRLNYTQHYKYDPGGNLIKLRHVRAGASHTREMCIDPVSNRGVRWKEGDPAPVFSRLFDLQGNLQDLQPGKALTWNRLDQLESVTLVKRDDGPDDEEFYRYSQGVRVYKRHETHTPSLSHFQEVIYLPGLEIRIRASGEELHVITLHGGHGSVRCLHWKIGKPGKVAADQLRYSLDDHLGSCAIELDQDAQVISQEGYYPFGATAWYARGSEVDVDYKTIRYSGKEMDDSGLYYYGARYYAPWLQRWVSADPAGDVDGLNLYGFVGNNPMRYIDNAGFSKTEAERRSEIKAFIENLSSATKAVDKQNTLLEHAFEEKDINRMIAKTNAFAVVTGVVAYGAGVAGGFAGGLAGTVTLPVVGTVAGVTAGAFGAKKAASKAMEKIGEATNLEPSITPKAAALSWETIKKNNASILSVEYAKGLLNEYNPFTSKGQKTPFKEIATFAMGRLVKQGAKELIQLGKLSEESNDLVDSLSPMKVNGLEDAYTKLGTDAAVDFDLAMENFIALGTQSLYSTGGVTGSEELTELKTIKADMKIFQAKILRAQENIARYRQRQDWPSKRPSPSA